MGLTLAEMEQESERVVVERVLVMVHRALDEQFPNKSKSNDVKFSKTIFTDEKTQIDTLPISGVSDKIQMHLQEKTQLPPPTEKQRDWLAYIATAVLLLAIVSFLVIIFYF